MARFGQRLLQCLDKNALISPRLRNTMAKRPDSAYLYADYVVQGRWPEGEAAIMTDPTDAYNYATNMLKAPWPEAEPVIATDAQRAYEYAYDVLGHRFEAGEPTIIAEGNLIYDYAKDVIKGEWEEAEDKLFSEEKTSDGDYFDRFLADEKYDNLRESIQEWLKKHYGQCEGCGDALPRLSRDHWTNGDGDGPFCSERCVNDWNEGQNASNVEYYTEELMADYPADVIQKAINYTLSYHKYLDGEEDVRDALIEGEFLPERDDE